MKKLLTAGIFGTLLTITGGADASIVSRGFFDEQIGNYATLDLLNSKANQSDLTDLSSKIGTLPTTITAEGFFGDYTLPDNIGEQLSIIFYGNNDRVNYVAGLIELNEWISGIDVNTPANKVWDSLYNGLKRKLLSGVWQEWRGLTEMDTNIKNNTAKIGTLPDGYETVGAALSAIKGIAEEAKAAALAAIPDPKTEGSNGKYVLTVDIIDDNATYRWEPIDRSESETTTTE
jgi:hypothetical protein